MRVLEEIFAVATTINKPAPSYSQEVGCIRTEKPIEVEIINVCRALVGCSLISQADKTRSRQAKTLKAIRVPSKAAPTAWWATVSGST